MKACSCGIDKPVHSVFVVSGHTSPLNMRQISYERLSRELVPDNLEMVPDYEEGSTFIRQYYGHYVQI